MNPAAPVTRTFIARVIGSGAQNASRVLGVRAAAAGFWESFRKGRLIAGSAGVYCEAFLFSHPFTA
jgi:hypothetical protein